MITANKGAQLAPQINSVLRDTAMRGIHVVAIRMAPIDVAHLAEELQFKIRQAGQALDVFNQVETRPLVWSLKYGYILQSVAGPVQVMPDLSVSPGHIEMSTAESIPFYGLQNNN